MGCMFLLSKFEGLAIYISMECVCNMGLILLILLDKDCQVLVLFLLFLLCSSSSYSFGKAAISFRTDSGGCPS